MFRALGRYGLGVVLIVLPGHAYSQSSTATSPTPAEVLNCNPCDLDVPDHPAIKGRSWFGPLLLAGSSYAVVVNDSRSGWHPHSPAAQGAAAEPEQDLLFASLMSSTLATNLAAQNQQNQAKPPAGQKQDEQHSPTATTGSPGHIFWVVPAFKVSYQNNFQPLTVKEKFQEWARGAYDPLGFGVLGFEAATLEHSSTDGFCGYGPGWAGYGKCFGSLELDANVSSFIGDFALTSLLHQDPRFFRLGKGSFGKRLWYAVSRVFVTYNDSGHTVFYSSALSGTVIAAGISNLYYPPQDRGIGHSMSRVALDLGNTALYNTAAEFWPDIHRKIHHIF